MPFPINQWFYFESTGFLLSGALLKSGISLQFSMLFSTQTLESDYNQSLRFILINWFKLLMIMRCQLHLSTQAAANYLYITRLKYGNLAISQYSDMFYLHSFHRSSYYFSY